MTDLPPPLTPPDCDLRDFAFMPLDVVRLRDSDLAALSEGDEFRCAVLLWCASWHQVPAGSLPDDDAVLSQYAGFGRVVKEWRKCREGAMRGWIKCTDGRLYHPVVAEKANEAWDGRVKYREKKESDRLRKVEERRLKKLQEDADRRAMEEALSARGNDQDNNDLSAGQNADVQRTTTQNPPENALTVDSGQGQWTVDSGQLTSTPEGTQPVSSTANNPTTAVGALCFAMRAAGIDAQPADPRMIALAEQGTLPETVTAACAEAKRSKPDERIKPGYVVAILERWAKDAAAMNVAGAARPQATAYQARQANTESLLNRISGKPRHERTDDDIIDLNERPAGKLG